MSTTALGRYINYIIIIRIIFVLYFISLNNFSHRSARNREDGSFVTESIKVTYDPGDDYLDHLDKGEEEVDGDDDGEGEEEEDADEDEDGAGENKGEEDAGGNEEEEDGDDDEEDKDDENDHEDNKGDSLSEASNSRSECGLYAELKVGMKRSHILGIVDCQIKFPQERAKKKETIW